MVSDGMNYIHEIDPRGEGSSVIDDGLAFWSVPAVHWRRREGVREGGRDARELTFDAAAAHSQHSDVSLHRRLTGILVTSEVAVRKRERRRREEEIPTSTAPGAYVLCDEATQ